MTGSSCHVITTDDTVVHGILYQDKEMKDMFQSFPEVLFVDATYRINNLQMALYVLLVEDGNGESEIVGFWLLREETAEMITSAVNQFVSDNPASAQVEVIMADKDFVEREAFATAFPNAMIHICCFHTLRTFRREVTVDKMCITAAQRDKALDFLQRMTYASSEMQYQSVYEDFVSSQPVTVRQYFDRNWHDIRHQWVCGLMSSVKNLGNQTNNRLESVNQKLKSVLSPSATLPSCLTSLRSVLTTLRLERDKRAVNIVHKKKVITFPLDDPRHDYSNYLTPYACGLISKQLAKVTDELVATVVAKPDTTGVSSVTSGSGVYDVTDSSCQCSFFTALNLPCQHILAVDYAILLHIFLHHVH